MAGDWIKMRLSLSREPEVVGMSIKTGIDTHGIVGRLHAVWAWADEVAEGGAVRFVGKAYIDRLTECDGFADAMEEVGWLKVKGDTVTFPNFDKHNGKSAKARADAASRKRKSRNAVPKAESGECHKNVTESCDKSVTREEKRREEKSFVSPEKKTGQVATVPYPHRESGRIEVREAAQKLLEVTEWPKPRWGGEGGVRMLSMAILRIADGWHDEEAASDPVTWIQCRMMEKVRDADSEKFVPLITNWIKDEYPHLAQQEQPA